MNIKWTSRRLRITPDTFRLIVKYIMPSTLEIDQENVASLRVASELLVMPDITAACTNWLNENVLSRRSSGAFGLALNCLQSAIQPEYFVHLDSPEVKFIDSCVAFIAERISDELKDAVVLASAPQFLDSDVAKKTTNLVSTFGLQHLWMVQRVFTRISKALLGSQQASARLGCCILLVLETLALSDLAAVDQRSISKCTSIINDLLDVFPAAGALYCVDLIIFVCLIFHSSPPHC